MMWQLPVALYLLLLIPLMAAAFWWMSRRARGVRQDVFDERLVASLRRGFWPLGSKLRLGFLLTALLFLVLGLAGPKLGTEVRDIEQKGVDLLIALDLSRSMNVQDIRPSRLEKAKFEISRLIDQSEGNRIGLLIFTGEAYLQSPLTLDHSALRMFLDIADTRQMPSTTTNFKSAFEMASAAFRNLGAAESPSSPGSRSSDLKAVSAPDEAANVMLLISDGENQGESYDQALRELVEDGTTVFAVGIGSLNGGPIPVFEQDGRSMVGYHRGPGGQVVNSRLEREQLQRIASQGGGDYYEIGTAGGSLDRFFGKLDELRKGTFSTQEFVDFKDQYQWMAGAGLLFLALAMFVPEARRPRTS